jgi:predicted AlkP superfamily pyrophosphatase or phosphodiesterase
MVRTVPALLVMALSFLSGTHSASLNASSEPLKHPRLVLVIVIDGLPQEQVEKYRSQLGRGGLRRLLDQGAWFSRARYNNAATFTAVGHATVLTGVYPYKHGLVANEWTDRETGESIYCVADPNFSVLGHEEGSRGVSPAHLKVPTLGDVLTESSEGVSRVLSISVKDRGAVLPGGKSGKAYFYNYGDGRFVTSSYYGNGYPKWWDKYYQELPQNQWFNREWKPLKSQKSYRGSAPGGRPYQIDYAGLGREFPHPLKTVASYYSALTRTPFGDDYTLDFVKAAVKGEKLGKGRKPSPDLLSISFSTHDYINHSHGPESIQSHDSVLRLDRTLADLFRFVDGWVGMKNTMVVLTADHGFTPSPEFLQAEGRDGGRMDPYSMARALNKHLSEAFGPGPYVLSWLNPTFYLNDKVIKGRGLSAATVESRAAEFLLQFPGVSHVYTRTELMEKELPEGDFSRQVRQSWDPDRSGDLFVVQKPGWYLLGHPKGNAATHGSAHSYDTNVPLMFLGPWFEAGQYDGPAHVVDLAPTLAHLLDLELPDADGRVLQEILK